MVPLPASTVNPPQESSKTLLQTEDSKVSDAIDQRETWAETGSPKKKGVRSTRLGKERVTVGAGCDPGNSVT